MNNYDNIVNIHNHIIDNHYVIANIHNNIALCVINIMNSHDNYCEYSQGFMNIYDVSKIIMMFVEYSRSFSNNFFSDVLSSIP